MKDNTDNKPVRIDKFLWAVRLYKTRSMAAEACQRGRILHNGIPLKPSKEISVNQVINVRKPPVEYSYKIIKTTVNRLSPKLVPEFLEDLTPVNEKEKLILQRSAYSGYRSPGTGRPTKKDRRSIEKWFGDQDNE
jgi:ribosome-associated heat shock protein Hsp15